MKTITLTMETSGFKAKQFTDDKGNKIDYFTICTPQGEIKASKKAIDYISKCTEGDFTDGLTFNLNKGIIKLITNAEAQNNAPIAW